MSPSRVRLINLSAFAVLLGVQIDSVPDQRAAPCAAPVG
jgi:hypothetical protein